MALKKLKLSTGTIYQTTEKGNLYFRYQLNRVRKCICLDTNNIDDAKVKVENEILPLINAPSSEVVAAHVQYAKGWKKRQERLEIGRIWEVYQNHPERARPKNLKCWKMYEAYLNEFLKWLKTTHSNIQYMDEIRAVDTYGQTLDKGIASGFSEYLKKQNLSVNTHNKKLARIANIFRALSKYLDAPSPWDNPKLRRHQKEETHITDHRRPFPKDKEKEMFKAIAPKSKLKLLNKAEIEVLFYILKYTGQRQKDCVNLSWNKISMDRKRIWVTQEKTGKDVSIPMAQELYEMLKRAESWKVNDKVLPKSAERYAIEAKDGTNTGVNLINKQLLNVIKYVGLEPSISVQGRDKKMTIYGVHSFRHGFASHCAETGIPRAVCASILGADSAIIDAYYVHIGEEAQEKAIMAITGSFTNVSDRERINKALALIDSCKDKPAIIKKIEKVLR